MRILVSLATENRGDLARHRLFNKAAIVLLSAKLESFLEEFVEEFCFAILSKNDRRAIHPLFHETIVKEQVNTLAAATSSPGKLLDGANRFAAYLTATAPTMVEYRPKLTFKQGRHGQEEIRRLLTAIGFKEYTDSPDFVSISAGINSLMAIRNNIVHEDATPNLTGCANLLELVDAICAPDKLRRQPSTSIEIRCITFAETARRFLCKHLV
ncbi:MAG: hypothetical protein K1X70_09590 [Leptospirales bacterium]|nr:hypothetical protein [Leptospirales bacterium]